MTIRALITAFAGAAACTAAAPANAEDFTILIYEPGGEIALRQDSGAAGKAYWDAYGSYAAELAKAGAVRGGAALVTASGGPDLRLSGYFMITAPSRAAAEAFAAAAPANRRGGRAEVRDQLPAMAATR